MAALDVVLETMEVEKTKEVREMEASDLFNSIGGSLGKMSTVLEHFGKQFCVLFQACVWEFPFTACLRFLTSC